MLEFLLNYVRAKPAIKTTAGETPALPGTDRFAFYAVKQTSPTPRTFPRRRLIP